MISRLKQSVYQYRLSKIQTFFDKKSIKPEDVIIISGTPRGGTTWVNEILRTPNEVFDLWEPLHPFSLEDFHQDGNRFWFDKYLPSGAKCEELEVYLRKLLGGKVITERFLQKNLRFKTYSDCDKLLIKFCRLNEMLPWFLDRFPNYKVLQVDRNPFSVVSSQMKHGAWGLSERTIELYKKRTKSYCFEFYEQFSDIINSISTPEEFLTVNYCLSVIPRLKAQSKNLKIVKYENLFLNPEEEFNSIFEFFNLQVPSNLQEIIRKPSSTTKQGSNILTSPEDQLVTWKKFLTKEQVENISRILNQFGFDNVEGIEYELTLSSQIKFY